MSGHPILVTSNAEETEIPSFFIVGFFTQAFPQNASQNYAAKVSHEGIEWWEKQVGDEWASDFGYEQYERERSPFIFC